MDATVKQKWVEALRSGKYQQGKGFLRTDDQFCCLGVLCDLHSQEINGRWVIKTGFPCFYDSMLRSLPQSVQEWAGIDSNNPLIDPDKKFGTAAILNDEGMPFNEIADLIEANL